MPLLEAPGRRGCWEPGQELGWTRKRGVEEGCDTVLLHTQSCTSNQELSVGPTEGIVRELRWAQGATRAQQPCTAPHVLNACTHGPCTGLKV